MLACLLDSIQSSPVHFVSGRLMTNPFVVITQGNAVMQSITSPLLFIYDIFPFVSEHFDLFVEIMGFGLFSTNHPQ